MRKKNAKNVQMVVQFVIKISALNALKDFIWRKTHILVNNAPRNIVLIVTLINNVINVNLAIFLRIISAFLVVLTIVKIVQKILNHL